MKATVQLDLSANGKSASEPITIDPTILEWVDIGSAIVDLAGDVLKFVEDFHQATYTCVNIPGVPRSTDTTSSPPSAVLFKPNVENCADHDETIDLGATSGLPNFASSHIVAPDNVHLNSHESATTRNPPLDIQLTVPDGDYSYTMHANVVYVDVFGNERQVDGTSYTVRVPEFNLTILSLALSAGIGGLILLCKRQKGLFP